MFLIRLGLVGPGQRLIEISYQLLKLDFRDGLPTAQLLLEIVVMQVGFEVAALLEGVGERKSA